MTGEAPALAYQDLLLSVYEAFNERDLDYILLVMHPDVDWPNGMEGGRVRGHDGLRDYWTRQWDLTDPFVKPQRFEYLGGGSVAVHVHQLVRDLGGNIIVNQMVQHVYLFRGPHIVSMEIRNAPDQLPSPAPPSQN